MSKVNTVELTGSLIPQTKTLSGDLIPNTKTLTGNITQYGSSAKWGRIKGDIQDQSDLIELLPKSENTEYWNNQVGYIPSKGEIIIYTDYQVIEEDGSTKYIPGIKVGTGNAYVQDLAFIDDDIRDRLLKHIEDEELHTTLGEKTHWSNKVNIDDAYELIHDELVDETLVFNRN